MLKKLFMAGILLAASSVYAAVAPEPLHGTVKAAEVRNGRVYLQTEWNRPPDGNLWIGFVQRQALYAAVIQPARPERTLALEFTLPGNLPAGDLEVICVPIAQRTARPAEGHLVIPAGLAAANAFPAAWGVYRDAAGQTHPWHVLPTNLLVWDGEPYIPFGGMINSKIHWATHAGEADNAPMVQEELTYLHQRLAILKQNGLRDIFFNGFFVHNNPNDLNRLVAACEEEGVRYGLHVSSQPARTSLGFIRDPANRVALPAGQTKAEISVDIPAADLRAAHRCAWVLLDGEEAVAAGIGRFTAQPVRKVEGKGDMVTLRATVAVASAARARTLAFLPELPLSPGDPAGYGESIEEYLRKLREVYGSLTLGPGMRLWIDPFGNEMHAAATTLCTSDEYRAGFAAVLMRKYQTVPALAAAWGVTGGKLNSFAAAARLLPLHAGTREVAWLDPESGARCTTGTENPAALKDLAAYRGAVCAGFINRAADTLKSIADVPVVLKHNCWFSDWFVNPNPHGGMDGNGVEAYCYGDSLVYHNSLVPYAQALQSARSQWVLVTESSAAAFEGQKPYAGYLDRLQMLNDIDQLMKLGSKGFYHFGLDFSGNPSFNTTDLFRDPRQLEWLGRHAALYRHAAERLARYRPEVYGWYPAHLRHEEILEQTPALFEMNGHYTGVKTQIRQCPDGRWMVPALRPDASWYGLLAALPLQTPGEQAALAAAERGLRNVYRLGPGGKFPLNGFTADGIGVVPPAPRAMTLDEFRQNVLGYRVFQTRDLNGQTLPDGRLLVWTCVERDRAEVTLPATAAAVNLQGKPLVLAAAGTGKSLTLLRPPYTKTETGLPAYLRGGYLYPDVGQPEVALLSGVTVDDLLKANPPVFHRWLPATVAPGRVVLWREAEAFAATTFTQPMLEGYSRYSGGSAIGINTHNAPPAGQTFSARYAVETPRVKGAVFHLRRMSAPAMDVQIFIDGRAAALIPAEAALSDELDLTPWNAGLGVDRVKVGWAAAAVGDLAAGRHTVEIVAVDKLSKIARLDTKLMGGEAEKNIGATLEGRTLRAVQLDAWMLTVP
jgi:hypothetical protein